MCRKWVLFVSTGIFHSPILGISITGYISHMHNPPIKKTNFWQAAHSEQSSHRLPTMWCTIFRIKGLNNLLVKYGFSHSTNITSRTTTHHVNHMTLSNVCCICGMVFGFRNSPFFLIYMCAWVRTFTIPVLADCWIVSHIFEQMVPHSCCKIC
jgi:hypothetical protein